MKVKETLKQLLMTKEGWISWIIANLLTSLPWLVPLAIGWITKNNQMMVVAASIWGFLIAPFTPLWVLNLFIALFILKIIKKKIGEKNYDKFI